MKKSIPLLISFCMLFAAFLTFISCPGNNGEDGPSIIPMQLIYQHKDTDSIPCNLCTPPNTIHVWNDAAGPLGVYGDSNDCPHCSTYCAPASIAMIAKAYGLTGAKTEQDLIYDEGKQTYGEVLPGIIESHNVGMFHGANTTDPEVQQAFDYAIDPMTHDEYNAGNLMTETTLKSCIENSHPVLWLDHNGWPDNLSDLIELSPLIKQDQGHAKVIAGYDDRGTDGVSDDLCLIYDPWPEYNDKQKIELLPTGATKGPDDTFDPYWLPVSSIIGDANDVFLVPQNSIE
jgi:hypothetical protein